jgi:hypothetical protein
VSKSYLAEAVIRSPLRLNITSMVNSRATSVSGLMGRINPVVLPLRCWKVPHGSHSHPPSWRYPMPTIPTV